MTKALHTDTVKHWRKQLQLLLLTLLMTVFCASDASANSSTAPVPATSSGLFTPLKDDISLGILALLLGDVGEGTDAISKYYPGKRSLFSVMVGVLNKGILYMAIFLLLYQLTASVINTAKSGRFLGERGTFWAPVRSVFGIVLLFPHASGYCLAQLIVIKIIIAGVGVADSLWSELNVYLSSGAQGVVKAYNPSLQNVAKQGHLEPIIFGSACMAKQKSVNSGLDPQAAVEEVKEGNKITGYNVKFYVNGTSGTACYQNTYSPDKEALAHSAAAASMLLIDPMVNIWGSSKSTTKVTSASVMQEESSLVGALSQFAAAYGSYISAANLAENKRKLENYAGYSKYGWAAAGIYFRSLLGSGQKFSDLAQVDYTSFANNKDIAKITSINNKVQNLIAGKLAGSDLKSQADAKSTQPTNYSVVSDFKASLKDPKEDDNFPKNPIVDHFLDHFSEVDAHGYTILSGVEDGRITIYDPFNEPVSAGKSIMEGLVAAAVMMFVLTIAVSFATMFAKAYLPVAYAAKFALTFLSMILMIAFPIAYKIGALMAIYLPLIPTLIFLIGFIGWLLFCLLAIVSAPLVALGIIWPDRNQGFMGKSAGAVLMYLNILLRPALMIVGLFAGTILCSIGFLLIIAAFTAANNLDIIKLGNLGSAPNWFVAMPLGMGIVMVMIAVAQKSYSLINLLPDRVLTWIGGQMSAWSFTQDTTQVLSSAKDGTEKGVSEVQKHVEGIKGVSERSGKLAGRVAGHLKEGMDAMEAGEGAEGSDDGGGKKDSGVAISTAPTTGKPSGDASDTATMTAHEDKDDQAASSQPSQQPVGGVVTTQQPSVPLSQADNVAADADDGDDTAAAQQPQQTAVVPSGSTKPPSAKPTSTAQDAGSQDDATQGAAAKGDGQQDSGDASIAPIPSGAPKPAQGNVVTSKEASKLATSGFMASMGRVGAVLKSAWNRAWSDQTYQYTDNEGNKRTVTAAERFDRLYGGGDPNIKPSNFVPTTKVNPPNIVNGATKKPPASAPQQTPAAQPPGADNKAPDPNATHISSTSAVSTTANAPPVVQGNAPPSQGGDKEA